MVYIKEAHPADGWALPVNAEEGIDVADPKSAAARHEVAGLCVKKLNLTIPTVIDKLDNKVADVYGGWPDRLYLIDKGGKIIFQGGPGPKEFLPEKLEGAIQELIGDHSNQKE